MSHPAGHGNFGWTETDLPSNPQKANVCCCAG